MLLPYWYHPRTPDRDSVGATAHWYHPTHLDRDSVGATAHWYQPTPTNTDNVGLTAHWYHPTPTHTDSMCVTAHWITPTLPHTDSVGATAQWYHATPHHTDSVAAIQPTGITHTHPRCLYPIFICMGSYLPALSHTHNLVYSFVPVWAEESVPVPKLQVVPEKSNCKHVPSTRQAS